VEVWRRWGGSTAEKWWRPSFGSGFGDRRHRWTAPTTSGRLGGGEVQTKKRRGRRAAVTDKNVGDSGARRQWWLENW
jgi:hypothetical protein